MRVPAAAVVVLMRLVGCESGDDTARIGQTADTIVTSHQIQDTTIVLRDTTVSVDTIRKEGDRPVASDTVKQTGPAGAAATAPPAPTDSAPRNSEPR